MDNRLKFLYRQVKERKISQEEALRQIKEFKAREHGGVSPSPLSYPGQEPGTAPLAKTGRDTDNLTDQVQDDLLQRVSQVLKVGVEDIDSDAELKEYGFDPVTLNEFARQLNREYHLELTPALFVEHPTLRGLTGYLLGKYREQLNRRFQAKALTPSPVPGGSQNLQGAGQDLLREKATHYFKRLLSSVIHLPAQQIEADAPLEQYGIDSIMVMRLTTQLEKTFGSLSKTLFFEYRNLRELTGYFLESHGDRLAELLGSEESAGSSSPGSAAPAVGTGPVSTVRAVERRRRFVSPGDTPPAGNGGGSLDIAIIGLSGRYPQAGNTREFWKNLQEGKDCITEIPGSRWDHNLYFDEDKNKPGKTYCKWGGFLEGVEQFDPLFFNISPREAVIMDPQERLFLECVYETLEDAGYTRESLGENYNLPRGAGSLLEVASSGSPVSLDQESSLFPGAKSQELRANIGVYVGVMYEEYQLYGAQATLQGRPMALAGNPSSIANRISYFCNFHGPSMAVDTMCSSSLTALHLACHSLRRGESDMVIAGGVNLSLHPNKYLLLGQGKFASSKGRCESFGQGGDGYVPGEGVGAVLLKPLAKAIEHRDHIYGVIKATAINHGGKTNGYFVPNPKAQAGVIGQAFQQAGISPATINYIEAHGTGTSLGDPIEIAALTKIFREYTAENQFCAIGSVKSNIGHCESAAGIAGLTKVLLQLRHGQLAPSLHSRVLNPYIDFSTTPFVVQQELAEWNAPQLKIQGEIQRCPRRAGISSFGAGGANAHVVIEEYIPGDPEPSEMTVSRDNPAIIVLSARSAEQLREQVRRLLAALGEQSVSSTHLADMAYTLQVGREAMEERLAVVVGSMNELREKLEGFLAGEADIHHLYRGQVKRHKEALAVFAGDDELPEAITRWIRRGQYGKLPDLWVKGLAFDWNRLYGSGPCRPRRISLPTYPFARETFWAPGLDSGISGISQNAPGPTPPASTPPLLLQPCWQERAAGPGPTAPGYIQHLAILCEPEKKWKLGSWEVRKLGNKEEGLAPPIQMVDLHSPQEDLQQRFQDYALRVFEEIQRILKDKPGGKVLIQLVVPNRDEQQLFSGLAGLLKTARLENPNLLGQLIEVEPAEDWEGLLEKLAENSRYPHHQQVRYQDGKPWIATWREPEASREKTGFPWRERGVYLITGGAGGLGLIFAREILQQVKDATLVLTGRSPLSQLSREKQAGLEQLQAGSARVRYRQVDISRKEEVISLIQEIRDNFGSLNGILHSAGVIHDNFIIKKTGEELQEVLAPKVSGLVHLDRASRDLALDFFILFSSAAGVSGNAGQADYSTANAFMDAYAGYRNALVAAKKRRGKTLSVDWPLWAEGGMRVDEETEKMMRQQWGIVPLPTPAGIRAFYQAFAAGTDQVLVLAGDRSGIPQGLLKTTTSLASAPIPASFPPVELEPLKEKTLGQLKILLEETLNLSRARIDPEEPLGSYGIDSIAISQLNQKLAGIFGELSKTLFYEYRTLEALSGYLVKNYPHACIQWAGLPFKGESPLVVAMRAEETPAPQETVTTPGGRTREPIAIIGMSARFPGARTPAEYWENLKAGKTSIGEIPPDRWDWREHYHQDPGQAAALRKSYSKWGGFLEEFDGFDPLFFNMSPREAESIDPQERLFLEECWKALEDAGYAPSKLSARTRQRTGVFGGITKQGFNLYGLETRRHFPATSFSSLVNRVSYFLDLQGPSIPVDTMCSSSLAALHEACEYLGSGKGELALAGGVNLYLHPSTYVGLSMLQILSASEVSPAFGKGGTGFVPGEGVGVVVLKPLHRALEEGDTIYALIRGTALNHGGKTGGYTIPNPQQQAAVIRQALAEQDLDPRTIGYIEAAANGSEMGDAIEMTALTEVFGQRRGTEGEYKIGSVKPNIGHGESASGMAQLIKVLLALRHKTLVPTLLTGELNPNIPFPQLPFQVQQEVGEWKPVTVDGAAVPRRAGITAVGAGGVNAHVILEEYIPGPAAADSTGSTKPLLFILSAKDPERLEAYVKQWLALLSKNPADGLDLERIVYTLQRGRDEMPCRLAVVTESREDLVRRLEQWQVRREKAENCYTGDLNHNKLSIPGGVDAVLQSGDLHQLARLWVLGNSIPWNDLYPGSADRELPRVAGLPTYPFKGRKCWLKDNRTDSPKSTAKLSNKIPPVVDRDEGNINKAVELYTLGTRGKTGEFAEEYLTFCPFAERVPGFSMSEVFLHPETYPDQYELIKAKQIEMRQVLFCREDFQQIHTLLDIGCGHGTDLIQIATLYPHIQAHGYTITRAQAELGRQRLEQKGLSSRVKIFHKDSAKDAFPGGYDLVIGLEVSFHIRDKQGLFRNIASSLNPGGRVLLMDYIANLRGPIADPGVEISIPTREDWLDLLSRHQLVIDEIIDVSPRIANFLYDPRLEQNIADLPQVARDTLRNYANQSVSLEKGWISYCLFKLKRDTNGSEAGRREYNAESISRETPYPEALAEMQQRGHIPYPKDPGTGKPRAAAEDDPGNPGLLAVKEGLQEVFAAVLGLQAEELDPFVTFKELGIGSLNAVALLEAINRKFGLALPSSVVLEYHDLASLAGYIAQRLQESGSRPPSSVDPLAPPATAGPVQRAAGAAREPSGIAIIGLSCRCAGARDQEEFWDLIREGKECLREIKHKRWLDFLQINSAGKVPAQYGAMEDIEYFDPLFFQVSPREAAAMDAAQRILLEESYKALEDSGYTPPQLREQAVGTFIGTMGSTAAGQDLSHLAMLGSDTSILASRIAYFLDLSGPALAINTACSSSLVAIDTACQKLKLRDIDLAIAGGISIYTHPGAFIAMNNAGMLSPSGQCRPFDQAADGIVVGDGVGVVILKRLADALRDKDFIYGIIRGSGTNQDGRTSGITVPSFLAQSRLEESVYRKNQIDVEGLQYIEAHGTGTKLGDPVEIHALTEAFKKFTPRKGFCAIGSLKANIGHTTAAAGVLGVCKVLLSLKHRQIPPSIHFNRENEHIDFADSPVYVNTTLKEWPLNSRGSRLAAVSSFGFSGTNAHLVIEEYRGNLPGKARVHEAAPGLLVLSAETRDGLEGYARKTREFIRAHRDIKLADILYTFQVGRAAMSYRLALAAAGQDQLIRQLDRWLEGDGAAPGSTAVGDTDAGENPHPGDPRQGNEALQKLGERWVKGSRIDWDTLYPAGTVKRLAGLPTYPFAREYFPVPGLAGEPGRPMPVPAASTPYLHPLVQRNTSDLSRQRFSSTFTGQEFFLADHVLQGQKILPAVVYLEMARAAVEQAAGARAQTTGGLRLKNLVWARPLAVNQQPAQVHIELFPGENGELTYKIYSEAGEVEPGTGGAGVVVHSQGSAVSISRQETPSLDLQALKTQCSLGTLSPAQCYEAFSAMGIDYGPGHRGIAEVYTGPHQVLAKLTLPSSLSTGGDQFVLHPSLMDSALQAAIGLIMKPGDSLAPDAPVPLKPALPFALQELEIHSPCTPVMWALVRYSSGSGPGDRVQKLDIDLSDPHGMTCVRMKGFSTRAVEGEAGSGETPGTLLLYPYWKEQAIAPGTETLETNYAQHLVIRCEMGEKWQPGSGEVGNLESEEAGKRPGGSAPPIKMIHLESPPGDPGERFQAYAARVMEEIRAILRQKPKGQVLIQVVIPGQGEQQLFFGLSGLLKTARLENPNLFGQLIGMEPGEDVEGTRQKLRENSRYPLDDRVRYHEGKRWVTAWQELEAPQHPAGMPWKDRGVYLLSGGAGGLGLLFAGEIARQVKGATLVLTGRSPLSALHRDRHARLEELQALGARIEYRQVDVTQKQAVEGLIQDLCREFGGLHGILHGAGVIRDNFILKKTRDELHEVLAPKVTGVVNLDQASRDLGLDFFIMFSSAAGAAGNIGQADYAVANAFMDGYAGYRSALAAAGQRQGKTLSINWPWWEQGGMQVDEETRKRMKQRLGIVPMPALSGLRAFYQAAVSGKDQVMVMEGDLERLRASVPARQPGASPAAPPAAAGESKGLPAIQAEELREKAAHYFKTLLSSVIQLPVQRIDLDAPLEKYGIDSIMVMQMTDQLEKTFGSLSKTLFFEYRNLRELSGYFLESHRQRLLELLGLEAGGETAPDNTHGNVPLPGVAVSPPPRFASLRVESRQEKTSGVLDIAIIGMAGRYPMARNTREFWKNLQDGRDCIIEIPKDRWDHSRYFDEDKTKPGKTYSKWGGFLEGVEEFDPLFFNISPREAEFLDPQERLFLECVYETLEDAGYTRESLGENYKLPRGAGGLLEVASSRSPVSLGQESSLFPGAKSQELRANIGVYVGVMYEEYQLYGAQEQALGRPFALSGNPSSIANRVSYFCNFQGPSLAVDTMCSSSLTAIHLACESIQRGRCQAAIAGGVNLSLHPNKYLLLGQGKFVSSKGRCESFGQGGDGYVPGEGVGAVLLKPLPEAIAHGDHIYGIIKATAINHGGKTNGYSVPNPKAQASVISQACQEGDIHPRTISYIEAHGTGTFLGDPVEIAGLTRAFREYTADNQFCAIGSAKSNIGHAESAAGIAGVTKVLLQLQQGQLAPSLHSGVLNPNIDFSATPFVVQQKLGPWQRPQVEIDGETREYPRIAGISSFGAGGSNAHVVIREYIPGHRQEAVDAITTQVPAIIVLSARNPERLREQARQLLAVLHEDTYPGTGLADIAYTLQLGREAMEERLAVMVRSITALREKLAAFLEGKDGIEDLYRGQVKRNKETLALFTADEELQEAIDKWIQRGKYRKLLDLWVKGLVFDWHKLYSDPGFTPHPPRRISLPTYPFARDRYWVPAMDTGLFSPTAGSPGSNSPAYLHPLLQQNTSDFSQQRFTSVFTGREFFLADHVVMGQRILPGAAYLEMARAAVEQSLGPLENSENSRTGIRLHDVVWLQPLAVGDQAVRVHTVLVPGDNGQVSYKIFSEPGTAGPGSRAVHSQGTAVLRRVPEVPGLNLGALQQECSRASLGPAQLYEAFAAAGLEYGPGHRGVEQVYVGTGQVLAKLSLPSHLAGTRDQFVLHPGLMDAAFQASVGLMFDPGAAMDSNLTASFKPALAFALQELEIFGPCTSTMWALVRSGDGSRAGDKMRKLDIDLVDEQGRVCVRMKEITSRIFPGERQADSGGTDGPLMAIPGWDSLPVSKGQVFPASTDRVLVAGGSEDHRNALRQHYSQAQPWEIHAPDTSAEIAKKLEAGDDSRPIDHIFWIQRPGGSFEKPPPSLPGPPQNFLSEAFTADERLIDEQDQGVLFGFRMIKALLGLGYGKRSLGWTVITIQAQAVRGSDRLDPTHAGLHGLMGSLAKEYPHWKIRVIDVEADRPWPLAEILSLPADPEGNAWGHRGRQWYRQQLVPLRPPADAQSLYRPGGVYVVIGGAGGIGAAWSEYMIRTYRAQITWLGRRPKDAGLQAKLDALAALGPAPRYLAADAADRNALEQAYREIKQHYPQIHGVIHSAVGQMGRSLANMDEEQFQNGLTAKIRVSVRIAQVFQKEPLDFILFFSSTNSFLKTRGQSSYAAGCTFKDAFAHRLSRERPGAVKIMNWGYWGSVGAIAESNLFRDWLAQEGIGSIEPEEAMAALETLLAGPVQQMALVKATRPSGLDGLNLVEEEIRLYPEHFTSTAQNLRNPVPEPKQDSPPRDPKPGTDLEKKEMDELLTRLMWGQLQSAGLFTEQDGAVADLKTKTGLPDLYHGWLEETITVLAGRDYLRRDGESYRVKDPGLMDMGAAWGQWDRQKGPWLEDPQRKAQVALIEAALRALPEILTGKRPATEVLFPNSSMELVEGIYKNNPTADYFNDVLAGTVISYIQERLHQDPAARLRILEIGAGTGGTSAMLFSKLQPFRDSIREYCYTDISKAFLMHAEKEYGRQNPYLTVRLFNVSAPLAGQGLEAGAYDIAIAANVLHAAKNLRQALRSSKAALKKNGLLVLNELSGNSLFLHLTFGLLEGWWRYEDPELRIPGCPGATPSTWQELLESEGFRWVSFPAAGAHDLGQQVITAESDGIVRQKSQPGTRDERVRSTLAAGVSSPEGHPLLRAKSREPGAKSHSPHSPRPTAANDATGQALEDYIKETIIEKLAEALKIDSHMIDVDESFADYGLDSILAVNLVQVINQTLGIELKITALFDYSSIRQLTTYILSQYGDVVMPEPGQREKPLDLPHEPVSVEKAAAPVQVGSYPHRFSRTPALPGAGMSKKEGSGAAVASNPGDLIAIIGMSGQFAGSGTVNRLWAHLAQGTELIEAVSRWDLSRYMPGFSPGDRGVCKAGSFLEDIALFDPVFFNISGVEATYMDPQQRFFLEESWKALEDAGYSGTAVQERLCGVYVGCQAGDYLGLIGENPPAQAMWGNLNSVLASRIAYLLNLQGPAVAIDTACSSSLVALHLACQGLRTGETDMALAGGVFIQSTPGFYISGNKAGMLSPSGHCYTFDQRADGFVPGESVGVVVLKRLAEALADGDHIYAVIRGSGINQDGTTNGITAPSANSQERLERRVYDTFHINPEAIGMVEAHGTATKLGDPIEFEALTRAFRNYTDKKEYCALGSIKTNIGHSTAASGIAGLIKVLLSLQHKQIPPSLNFQSANANIDLKESPFYVNTALKDWVGEPGAKRCAAVSSFGLSGTNAHLVVEEAPPAPGQERPPREKPGYLIVLSARTAGQLRRQVEQLLDYCEAGNPASTDCGDIGYTLLLGRKHFKHRLACVVRSREELARLLEKWLETGSVRQLYVSKSAETDHREQPALKRYGNQCIRQCRDTANAAEYLESLAAIAELYTQGYGLEYGQLFSKEPYARVSLPTYPFERERYWVSEAAARPAGSGTAPAPAPAPSSSLTGSRVEEPPVQRTRCLLKKHWEPCPVTPTPTPSQERTAAILASEETGELAALLASHFPGSRVLLPRDVEDQLRYPVDPGRWKDYDGCVDLTGCGTGRDNSPGWLAWLQQLVQQQSVGQGHREGLPVLCVTRGLESFPGNTVNLAGASRAGLFRMLQSEYSHLRSRHMDVDPGSRDHVVAQQIAAEFRMDSRDPEVCYRDGERWRAYLREIPTGSEPDPPLVFPPDQVLWITGGTRGLGYLCARHFVTRYGVKRVVLTGREALPPRDQWDSLQGQNSPAAKKIEAIGALEALGADVRVLPLPLTEEAAVRQALGEIKHSLGPVGGILHCAGMTDAENPAFIRKSLPGIRQVSDPKITGLEILSRCFKNEPLQFFVVFSSVSAIIPGLAAGQSDYAMANAYMDYAAEARLEGCPLTSIQWPNWQESGMGELKTDVYRQTGLLSLTDAEGLQFLDQILAGKLGPVVLPAVVDPGLWKPGQLLRHTNPRSRSLPGHKRPPGQPAAVDHAVDLAGAPGDLLKATQQWLLSLFAGELKLDVSKLEIDTPFQDYGVDSILLAQLLQQINRLVPGELDPSILYEHSTIESFAAWLVLTYPSSLSAALAGQGSGPTGPQPRESLPLPALPTLPAVSSVGAAPRQGGQDGTHPVQAANPADVAVIGLSCRFPGAGTLEEYWQLLSEGRSAIGPVPRERWGYDNDFYAGLIDGIMHFDPKFFLVPPEDVKAMDPQAFVVLEESLKLFYQAGYSHREIKGKPIGVFLGGRSQYQADESALRQARNLAAAVGQNYLAANISHFFDLRGPALVLDTACSSALVGMNMAIQALQGGEIESALVGGVSLLLSDATQRMFQQRGILSREPHFHIFDQRAGGVIPGEGAGLVLLKTVPRALQDGDHIYAVIKALAINNDGRTAGPATPNLQAQKEVMQRALAKSGRKPGEISYIEANGSGSQVTDLLELKAIQSVYRPANRVPCGLGSVKPNIGHPLCAEGIAGFIKVVLMLRHRQWVPFLSGQQPLEHFDLEASPFYFCRRLTEWAAVPRVAAINCFADGGTNAHAILEAWADSSPRPLTRHPLPPPPLERVDIRHVPVPAASPWKSYRAPAPGKPMSTRKEKTGE